MNNNIITTSLKDLYFSKFTFNAEVTEDIYLSQNKGSTFRGGFGNAFKKFVCFNPKEKDCNTCILKKECSYYKIFRYKREDEFINKLGISGFAPKPYVLEPPITNQLKFPKTERFSFNIILTGWAIKYLPYFIIIFENLGEKFGLGKRVNGYRGKFKIINVINNGNEIYSGKTKILKIENIKEYTIKDFITGGNITKIKLNFITPTRIEVNKKRITLNEERNSKTLILRLYKRLILQQLFYCNGGKAEYLIDEVGKLADEISLTHSGLFWSDLYRWKYNSNSDNKSKKVIMEMGGFTGQITIEGNLTPFIAMIKIGEFLHVGKHYTFGLGKYEIIP